MPSRSKVLGDRTVRGEKPLRMAGRFESLHAKLALTRWPMGVLTPVIEIATLAVFDPGQYLPLGRAIILEFIRDG